MRKLIQAVSLIILAGAFNAYAEAPNLLTYQGRLKEGGQAVSGNRPVEIYLCDDATADPCQSSGVQSVTVSNGLFRSTFTIPALATLGAGDWYLEIWVAGTKLLPRERLTSTAYSLFAATAAYANNISAAAGSNGVYISSNLYVTGNVSQAGVLISSGTGDNYFAGKVGIGELNPSVALDVNGSAQFGSGVNKSTFTAEGFWRPRAMTSAEIQAAAPPAEGAVVFNSIVKDLCVSTGTAVGQWALAGSRGIGDCF